MAKVVIAWGTDCSDCQFFVGGRCEDHSCPTWIQNEIESAKWTTADWKYDRERDKILEVRDGNAEKH